MNKKLFYSIYRESTVNDDDIDEWLDDSGPGVRDNQIYDRQVSSNGRGFDDDTVGGSITALGYTDLLSDEELEDLGWHKTGRRSEIKTGGDVAPWGYDLFTKGDPDSDDHRGERTRYRISNSINSNIPVLDADKEFHNSNAGDDAEFAGEDYLDDDSSLRSDFNYKDNRDLNFITPTPLDTTRRQNYDDDDLEFDKILEEE